MNPDEAGRGEAHHIAGFFQSHWLLFILLGGLLIAAGGVAIVVPAISSIAPNEVLGLVLIFVGIVQIAQSGKMTPATTQDMATTYTAFFVECAPYVKAGGA